MTKNEKILHEAVRIAAGIMHDTGLCLYEDPASQCRHVYPPESRDVCDKCIEHWLLQKARARAVPCLTNADQIRSMSDEELADFLIRPPEEQTPYCQELAVCHKDLDGDYLIPLERCRGCLVEYLKREVTDNGDL